ncbi:MAG: NUDIX hydrolase [Chloroflexi bacterium]|nr:NUDIX hydrolase [Chloroflexota bacterium]
MTRQIAALLRRFPFLLRFPYMIYSRAQARYTLGVAAVVFDDSGQVLLVEHAYHPRYPWGLPGGWVDGDEDPSNSVLRELKEELQLEAEALLVVHASKTAPNHLDLAFLCEARGPIGALSHELLGFRWVDAERLPSLKPFHRRSIEAARALHGRSMTWERA